MSSINAVILENKRINQIRKQNARNVVEIRKEVRDLIEKKEKLMEEETDLEGTNNILQTKIDDAKQRLFHVMNQKQNETDSMVSFESNHNQKINVNEIVQKLQIQIEQHSKLKEIKEEQMEKINELQIAKKSRELALNEMKEETEKMNNVYQLLLKNKEIRISKS